MASTEFRYTVPSAVTSRSGLPAKRTAVFGKSHPSMTRAPVSSARKPRPCGFGPKQDIVIARSCRKREKSEDVGLPGSFVPFGALRDVRLHDADMCAALRRGI